MAEPTPIRPRPVSEIAAWDYEADVVVAGYGIAGVSASIEAARAGAEVLVLERTSGWGGAASLAGASSTSVAVHPFRKPVASRTRPRT